MFEKSVVGDRCWTVRHGFGFISSITEDVTYPIKVEFERRGGGNLIAESFGIDGRECMYDTFPSLFHDEIPIIAPPTPLRKVVKTISRWVNVYPNYQTMGHESESIANDIASVARLACVELTGTYTVLE